MKRIILSILSVTLLLGLAACTPEPSHENIVHMPDTAPATGTPEAAPQTATAADPTAGQTSPVQVTLTEYRIEMPATLPAGPTTFAIRNAGQAPHNFEIEGQGIEQELENDLQPGESGTLEVNLQPGTYRIYCPVGNHATEHGMEMQLTVQ